MAGRRTGQGASACGQSDAVATACASQARHAAHCESATVVWDWEHGPFGDRHSMARVVVYLLPTAGLRLIHTWIFSFRHVGHLSPWPGASQSPRGGRTQSQHVALFTRGKVGRQGEVVVAVYSAVRAGFIKHPIAKLE